MHRTLARIVIVLALASLARAGLADVIVLTDGRTLEGRVLEETPSKIVFESMVSNIRSVEDIPKFRIRSHEKNELPEDFFEPKRRTARERPEPPARDDTPRAEEDSDEQKPADTRAARSDEGDTRYAVVPIKGKIGGGVSAYALKRTFQQLTRRRVDHAVLVVDSPGGYVYEAHQLLEVLEEYDDGLTYHVFIDGGAISAASVFAAAADHLYVAPVASLGGAVAYTEDTSSGAAEVDAKFNSIWASGLAARAHAKGRSPDAFRAMVVQEAELWLASDGTLTASSPGEGGQRLDGPGSILTLDGSQMVRAGLAEELPEGVEGIGALRSLPGWTELRNIGTREMESSAKERVELLERRDKALEIFRTANEDFVRDHPRSKSYTLTYTPGRQGYGMEGESRRRWTQHSDAALRAARLRVQALEELVSVHKRAEVIGALHLRVSEEHGNRAYNDCVQDRDWLISHRNNPPIAELARNVSRP